MSTTSMIWVRVREEDFGKVMKADITKLPNPIDNFNYPCSEVLIHSNPTNKVLYMGIYCHYDGYPSGVGTELNTKFTTYEQVLNLILLGGCSYIIDTICSYHNWRNEGTKIIKKEFERPKYCGLYNYEYIFEDGEWITLS